ncbi:uncharacterized protein [Watersipora subatra]|uniref:uncharacterized protein n=1 Tax=Watersipora subatra TaxID=2589382 RepID=UPI00355B8B13
MPPYLQESAMMLSEEVTTALRQTDSMKRIKCVLIGDGAIGKTSLIVSYTTNGYPTEYVPTAFDKYTAVVSVDEQPVHLQLCDTAGQDDFDAIRPLCYPNTDVFLLCYSVVSPTSYHNITEKWLSELKEHAPNVPVILVGTQTDLRNDVRVLVELHQYKESPVTPAMGERLAAEIGAVSYIECSSLTQTKLKEVFDLAILTSMEKQPSRQRIVNRKPRRHRGLKSLLSCFGGRTVYT